MQFKLEDLKIGMKVKLIDKRPLRWNHDGLMDKYLGQIVTIKNIKYGHDVFTIEEDDRSNWPESWLFGPTDVVAIIPKIGEIVQSKGNVQIPAIGYCSFIGQVVNNDMPGGNISIEIINSNSTILQTGSHVLVNPETIEVMDIKPNKAISIDELTNIYSVCAGIDIVDVCVPKTVVKSREDNKKGESKMIPNIEKYIVNEEKKSVVVFFKDGTKTFVTCMKDDKFDLEIGIEKCILKKMFGDAKTQIRDVIRKQEKAIKDKELAEIKKKEEEQRLLAKRRKNLEKKIKMRARREARYQLEYQKALEDEKKRQNGNKRNSRSKKQLNEKF